MTLEEMKSLSPDKQKELIRAIGMARQKGKTAGYAAVYGAGAKTIAEAAKIPESEGIKLHEGYWELNWSVKAAANDQIVKLFYKMPDGTLTYKMYKGSELIVQENDSREERTRKQRLVNNAESLWLKNPVNGLYYSLRFPKDIWSTLVQGTGTYAFDTWIKHIFKRRKQITYQAHDECVITVKKGSREQCEKLLRDAIRDTNEELKLNRELDIDVQFGNSYKDIH